MRPYWLLAPAILVVGADRCPADGPARFERVVIDNAFPGGYQVEVADVNGDGKLDIVGVGGGRCAWFENPSWTKRVVSDSKVTPDIISSATADLDGDGKAEIAIAYDFAMNEPNRGKLLLATQGARPVDPWSFRAIADVPSIHRLRWGDVDPDGKLDLVVGPIFGRAARPPSFDQDSSRIVVYRTGLDPKAGPWSPEEVGGDLVSHAIKVLDHYGQGRSAILAAGDSGVTLFDRAGGAWSSRVLTPGAPGTTPKRGSSEVQIGKLAGGSRFLATVDPWHGQEVAIAIEEKTGEFGPRTVIESSMVDGHALWVADVDGDGDDEVFAGYRGGGGGVLMFDLEGSTWKKTVLDPALAAQDLRGGDLDGDGTPDLVAIGGRTHDVVWYRPIKAR